MDIHNQAMVVSVQCSAHMHSNCEGKCACGCHQICSTCRSKCQATYDVSENIGEPFLVCADCYVSSSDKRKKSQCQSCGDVTAYRNPAVGDFYLCFDCHQQYAMDQVDPFTR